MDQKTLLDKIESSTDLKPEDCQRLLSEFCEIIGECCGDLDSVALPGFGQFEGRKRDERIAVHPASGRRMLVPPRIQISFKPSALLKQKIR